MWKIPFPHINPSSISQFLEIWNFQDPNNIQKLRVASENNMFSSGSYIYPHILQVVSLVGEEDNGPPYDEEGGPKSITKLTVWKQTMNPLGLTQYLEIPDVDKFFQLPNGSFRVDQTQFVNGIFLVTCSVPLDHGNGTRDCLSVRIVDENGVMLKQCLMPQFSINAYVAYFCYDDRLIITIDDDVYICLNDMPDLKDPDSESPMGFRHLQELGGKHEIMLRKFEATGVSVQHLSHGRNRLILRNLNFWQHIYPDPDLEENIKLKVMKRIAQDPELDEETDSDSDLPQLEKNEEHDVSRVVDLVSKKQTEQEAVFKDADPEEQEEIASDFLLEHSDPDQE